jgi:hypothetical protein
LENSEIVEARPEMSCEALGQLLFSISKSVRPTVGEVKPSESVAVACPDGCPYPAAKCGPIRKLPVPGITRFPLVGVVEAHGRDAPQSTGK